MEMETALVTAISYHLGDLQPLGSAARDSEEQDAVNNLLALGFETYARSSRRTCGLAAASIRGTLSKIGVDPSEIETVLFATESFWDVDPVRVQEPFQFRAEMYQALWEVGLKGAYPL